MYLSDHSLRQIDDAYLQSLDAEALRGLSLRLLADLQGGAGAVESRTDQQFAATE